MYQGAADPDSMLGSGLIYMAPYPTVHGKLFSLDNRRLFCLKWVYPPHQAIAVHPFSTVTDGESIFVKPKGYKRGIGHTRAHTHAGQTHDNPQSVISGRGLGSPYMWGYDSAIIMGLPNMCVHICTYVRTVPALVASPKTCSLRSHMGVIRLRPGVLQTPPCSLPC